MSDALSKSGTTTRVVDKAKNAQATLEIISAENDKQIMSVSGGGRVREFELRYRVSFRLVNAKGEELIPTSEIALRPHSSLHRCASSGERRGRSDARQRNARRLCGSNLAAAGGGKNSGNQMTSE